MENTVQSDASEPATAKTNQSWRSLPTSAYEEASQTSAYENLRLWIMKIYGAPRSIVADGLRAYSAAMNEIGVAAERHEVGGRLNNRAENSHQPFRRCERAMQRFRSLKTLQKFSSVHAQVHNQFNQERYLVTRQIYKQRRSAALAEWRALVA
jgi:putative transposase